MAFENIDNEDSYGFTPAFVAAMSGLSKNVEFLISKGANIKDPTKQPQSPRSLLLQSVQQSKVTVFWNSTMLQAATVGGHINVLRSLLKKNASFVDANGVNLTAIQLAALNGHLDVIQFLHKSGARLDYTLLQLAAAGGHPNTVKFLLQAGVRVAVCNVTGQTGSDTQLCLFASRVMSVKTFHPKISLQFFNLFFVRLHFI